MGITAVCPQCGEKLRIKRPTGPSTKVKCRQCGAKFHANSNDDATQEPVVGQLIQPGPSMLASPDVETPTSTAVASRPRHSRRSRRENQTDSPRAKWIRIVGSVALVALIAAGIASQLWRSPAPPVIAEAPDVTSPASLDQPFAKNVDVFLGAIAETKKKPTYFYPPELIGLWQIQDPQGGTIELLANGRVKIKGKFIQRQDAFDFETNWFILGNKKETFDVEAGTDPNLVSNHKFRIVRRSDGTYQLAGYVNSADVDVRVRNIAKQP